jgi:hypothetical protein
MDFNNDSGLLSNVSSISSTASTITFVSTGAVTLPTGNTIQRPTSAAGELRYNSDFSLLEFNNGTAWANIQASSSTVTNLDSLTDVTVTSPTTGQILQFNGSLWVNSSSSATSATGVLSAWTLVSGSRYYADFSHNLGTNNVVIQLYDNTTNAVIQADSIVLNANTNTVRVTVIGNSRTLRIVVIANGMYAGIMNGGGVPTIIEDLYANRPAAGVVGRLFIAYDTKVFYRDTGTTWDIVSASSGTIKSYSFYANSVDSPNTADFAVNALAPVISDATNTSINVRSFSNTVEQGVAVFLPIPVGAVNITFSIRGRAATAPATATTVQHKIYTRQIPNNAAMSAWSTATSFTAFTVPTNAYYQLYTQTYSLSTLGLVVGNTYQLELTRAVSGLAYAWLVPEIVISFT